MLEPVTFANPETGYTIARIASERGSGFGAELVTLDQGSGRDHDRTYLRVIVELLW